MRVFVFSHIRLFVEALAVTLRECNGISDVTTCYQADQLVNQVIDGIPDIVLIDVTTECALMEARAVSGALPMTPVIAISLPETAEKVIACADAGLVGYVPRQASINELLSSMLRTLKGECLCNPKIAAGLLREIRSRQKLNDEQLINDPLTHRECEILQLVGQGRSNKQIASELILSVATVKNHLHNIFAKLHIHSRAEALTYLRNEPWITKTA